MKLTGTTLQTGYFGLKLLWHLPLLGLAFGCTWVKLLVPVMIGVGLATAAANALFTERCSVALALQVCLAAFFAAGFTSGAALEILLYRSAFAAMAYWILMLIYGGILLLPAFGMVVVKVLCRRRKLQHPA